MDSYHPAPSDPYIVVNSTNFPSVISDVSLLPAGKWALGWSYTIASTCTPNGNILHIESDTPVQGSIGFTMKDGGASPDFTSNCSTLAGQIGIAANWTGCPQIGAPVAANPWGQY